MIINTLSGPNPLQKAQSPKSNKLVIFDSNSLMVQTIFAPKDTGNPPVTASPATKFSEKPIIPSEKEQNENTRSRSAKLRIFEKK